MLNEEQEKRFKEMVESGIEDLTHQQSDEQKPLISNDDYIELDSNYELGNYVEYPDSIETVHSPSHYDITDTNVQEMIEKLFTHEEFIGWLKGNILKYRLRAGKKGNAYEDIEKADKYQEFYNIYLKKNQP